MVRRFMGAFKQSADRQPFRRDEVLRGCRPKNDEHSKYTTTAHAAARRLLSGARDLPTDVAAKWVRLEAIADVGSREFQFVDLAVR